MKKICTWMLVASVLVTVAQCAPKPRQRQRALDVFDDLQASISNLVDVATNRIESAVSRTTNIMNTMSNTLWETLRTRDKFQVLDQTEKLGTKLSSASTNFLQSTSAVFSDVFDSTYETLSATYATKTNIANQFLDVTENFVSRTGNLVSSWFDEPSMNVESLGSTQSIDDQKTKRTFVAESLLNQTILLVNATNSQLAKMINSTSVLLDTSMDSYFVNALINSTARIFSATTNSVEKLLDSTNHLIEDVINTNQETATSAYNATTKLLNATSETVSSFLRATTLLISDAANATMLDNVGSNEPTIRAMHATKQVLGKIFNKTTTLMQDVVDRHENVVHNVADTTGNFLEASMDVKSNIITKTINFGKNLKKTAVHLVAQKLQSAADKLVSALDHLEQHFDETGSTQSKPQPSLDQAEQQINQTQSQPQLISQANDAQVSEMSPPEIATTPIDVQTEPIIQIENENDSQAPQIENDSIPPTVDSSPETLPSIVSMVKLDYHNSKRQQQHQSTENETKISPISAEWDTNWPGPKVIVEVSEKSPITISQTNGTNVEAGPKIIVRTEEVLIVLAILLLWIGAIALFFNRWGKIRMLEPYQPKFQQQHRASCPLVELESIPAHKPSFSRCSMGISLQMPPGRMGSISGPSSLYTVRASPLYSRNRQNSVFVGPQFVAQKPSRKYRSAMDIHTMVLDEAPEPV